jgi:hypothetical protein
MMRRRRSLRIKTMDLVSQFQHETYFTGASYTALQVNWFAEDESNRCPIL